LSAGVLQGDTLAPYLFVVVLDYVLYNALSDQSLGFQLTKRLRTRSRTATPATYITDLDFADDIMLTADCVVNAQIMLTAIEVWALKVGHKINLKKTEFLLVGNWNEAVTLSGAIAQVNDFKYLGSWLMNCQKDFEVRKTLAWEAATKLVRMWKQKRVSRQLKLKLFLACVETVLLYNATTRTMTKTLTKRSDGCYTRLLRYALGYKWSDKIRNTVLYGNLK
jgi:hypothetical protein